jgi:hypothetical protein
MRVQKKPNLCIHAAYDTYLDDPGSTERAACKLASVQA